MNTLDGAFFKQVREAAQISRSHSKHKLVGELMESNRIIEKDTKQIFELSEKLNSWERWAKEVCEDFRIPFDDHPVSLRQSITLWMREHQNASSRL